MEQNKIWKLQNPKESFKYNHNTLNLTPNKNPFRVTPKRHAPFPKVVKLRFWSQKMRNVLKRMPKQFSDIFEFICLTKFWDFLSKHLVLLRFQTTYVSEDHKKTREKIPWILFSSTIFLKKRFLGKYFFLRMCWKKISSKSEQNNGWHFFHVFQMILRI